MFEGFIGLVILLLPCYPPGWSDDILISPDSVNGTREKPVLDTDRQCNVWIAFDSLNWGGGCIYASKRDSLGSCLIPTTLVSASGYSQFSRICVDESDNVHITWREGSPLGFGLGYTKLSPDGSVLVPAHLVVNGAGGAIPWFDMGIDRDKYLHVVWGEESGDFTFSYSLLDSVGDTIVGKIQLSPPDTHCFVPSIGVDSAGNNHITFRSDSGSVSRLFYMKTDMYGNTLIPDKIVALGSNARVLCDKHQNVHICYQHNESSIRGIYYIKLDNSGNMLISPICLSIPPYQENGVCYADLDSLQNLHVVWSARDIWFKWVIYTKMDTSGNILVPPVEIVYPPYTPGVQNAKIAADHHNRLHVAWMDGRLDSIYRIYYKRGENEQGVDDKYGRTIGSNGYCTSTIMKGPLTFPEYKTWRLFDISGREILTLNPAPGIYFLGVDGNIKQKIVKIE